MIRNVKTSIALVFILHFSFSVFADKTPIKFGNVSEEELIMKQYDLDTAADAVILCDYGTTVLRLDRAKGGFQVLYERTCRIKIFNRNGYDWATESISLFNNSDTKESITNLKGCTYNLIDGKIEKVKLTKQAIFEEKTSDEWTRVKFTLPDVKEGSVIEFNYQVTSDFLSFLNAWEFQKEIPVKWSEYIVEIPEYFNYMKISSGFEPFVINQIKDETRTETFMEKERSGNMVVKTDISTSKLQYRATIYHWAVENAPGLKDERFVSNMNDYLTKIEFQLSNFTIPGLQYENVLGTWNDINYKLLVQIEEFKNNISGKNFYKEDLEKILANCQDAEEKMAGIYRFVSNRMQWNGKNSYIPGQNIKKTYDDRTGSSADINALLISMLVSAGIKADPVILSTRDNGLVHPIYPILSKYNYLIAMATIEGKNFLLDATEKNIPAGMLPLRCLNQRGRCISQTRGDWVNLQPAMGAEETYICNFTVDNGQLYGNIQSKLKGYSGIASNQKFTTDGQEKYIEALQKEHVNWDITDYEADNQNPHRDGFKEKIGVKINNAVVEGGDMIYLEPIIVNRWEDNPLKNEDRKLPVDFNFPVNTKFIANITLPDGYAVEELPESVQFSLPDKSAIYSYMTKVNGPTLQLINNFEIKKSFYTAEEYSALREFWALVVNKSNEQIVLKKKAENDL
jgi:hypothetical protein